MKALLLALALLAADPVGSWTGSIETQGGTFNLTIQIQAASPLAGSVKTDMFEGKIENGKVDGDKIQFEVNIEQGKLAFEGTVAAEELKLTVTGPSGNKYPMTCKRQK